MVMKNGAASQGRMRKKHLQKVQVERLPSLKLTPQMPLELDGWNMILSFWNGPFWGGPVHFRGEKAQTNLSPRVRVININGGNL